MEAHPDGPVRSGAAAGIDGIERTFADKREAPRRIDAQATCLSPHVRCQQVDPAHSAVATDHLMDRQAQTCPATSLLPTQPRCTHPSKVKVRLKLQSPDSGAVVPGPIH